MNRLGRPQASDMAEGSRHNTKYNGVLEIVEYRHANSVDVRFIDTGYETTTYTSAIRKGIVKDRLKGSIYGVGYHGSRISVMTDDEQQKPSYVFWRLLLERCYNEKCVKYGQGGALGHTICEDWKNYTIFEKWYDENHKEGLEMHLKDGETIYSPDTIEFKPRGTKVSQVLRGTTKKILDK